MSVTQIWKGKYVCNPNTSSNKTVTVSYIWEVCSFSMYLAYYIFIKYCRKEIEKYRIIERGACFMPDIVFNCRCPVPRNVHGISISTYKVWRWNVKWYTCNPLTLTHKWTVNDHTFASSDEMTRRIHTILSTVRILEALGILY